MASPLTPTSGAQTPPSAVVTIEKNPAATVQVPGSADTPSATTVAPPPAQTLEEPAVVSTPSTVATAVAAPAVEPIRPVPLAALPTPLAPAREPALPSLSIIVMSISPPSPVRGQQMTAFIQGVNQGNEAAEKVPVRVDLDYEALGRWIHVASVWGDVARLAPGEEISMQQSVTIPSQVPRGRYRFTASVDPESTIPQASGNRTRTVEFTLQ